jgi:hypothetical protein
VDIAMTNVCISVQNIDQALHYYSDFRDNWDQDGAIAPKKEALDNAIRFMNLMKMIDLITLPSVFLSKEGEINFIFENSQIPLYLDIGFIESGYSYYAIDINENKILNDSNTYNEDDLVCLLKIFQKITVKMR